MRQGYELYSDGLYRRVFTLGVGYKHGFFMQVRKADGSYVRTVRGGVKILTELAGVQRLTNASLRPGTPLAQLLGVPEKS